MDSYTSWQIRGKMASRKRETGENNPPLRLSRLAIRSAAGVAASRSGLSHFQPQQVDGEHDESDFQCGQNPDRRFHLAVRLAANVGRCRFKYRFHSKLNFGLSKGNGSPYFGKTFAEIAVCFLALSFFETGRVGAALFIDGVRWIGKLLASWVFSCEIKDGVFS